MLVKTRRGSSLTEEHCELTFQVFKVHLNELKMQYDQRGSESYRVLSQQEKERKKDPEQRAAG